LVETVVVEIIMTAENEYLIMIIFDLDNTEDILRLKYLHKYDYAKLRRMAATKLRLDTSEHVQQKYGWLKPLLKD
jgi:hypothetical protein